MSEVSVYRFDNSISVLICSTELLQNCSDFRDYLVASSDEMCAYGLLLLNLVYD